MGEEMQDTGWSQSVTWPPISALLEPCLPTDALTMKADNTKFDLASQIESAHVPRICMNNPRRRR